jgi:hypothetical protein
MEESLKTEDAYFTMVVKMVQTFVTKLSQICEERPALLFEPVPKSEREASLDSGRSDKSNSNGNWVKKIFKIQKVLKLLENNVYAR